MDLFTRSDTRAQLLAVGAVGLIVLVALGRSAPAIPGNIDPAVYQDIVNELRSGQEFHQTVDSVFRRYGMGPVDSVLAIRSPIGFWWLALVGNDTIVWIIFLLVVTAAALVLGSGLDRPVYAIGVIWYFAVVGMAAWTAPELWAAVLVVMAVGLALRDRWVEATIAAAVATSLRELAVLVLIGLFLSRLRYRSGWSVPIVGAALCAGLYLWHWSRTAPFLVADGSGRQAELLGTGQGPGGVLEMMSTWLPGGIIIGPILFLAAVSWAHRHDAVPLVVPAVGLVLAGLIVDRPEWAIFVVPLTLPLGADEIEHRIRRRLRSSPTPVGTLAPLASPQRSGRLEP